MSVCVHRRASLMPLPATHRVCACDTKVSKQQQQEQQREQQRNENENEIAAFIVGMSGWERGGAIMGTEQLCE